VSLGRRGEDLGNALRKIRVDLGIPIDFDDLPIHGPAEADRAAGRYCALGRIKYSVVDQGARRLAGLHQARGLWRREPRRAQLLAHQPQFSA
jgi:hypothetical protein